MTNKQALDALDRIYDHTDSYIGLNDDREAIRTAITRQPEPVNAQLLEALKKLLEASAMQQKYGGGMPTWIFEKAKAAIAAAEKAGV
ncbi:hypothetical protein [Caudoviricetes sp.]|nr:hypothetical protein [Caudoviricetes sp.]